MQFKKNRAILSAVLASAMAASTLLSVTASAAGTRKKAETFGDKTYAQRFMSLYDDVYTHGKDNGYLSKDGVPYHSVEELICEAPDYGHETTSEAMSYIVWIAAMHDNLVKKGVVDGASGSDLANAWKTLEALIPSADQQQGFFTVSQQGLSAQVSAEHPDDIGLYPSTGGQSNVGKNPLGKTFATAYSTEGREYLLHWLADVDDWYGFGGSARGEKGNLTFINTFQRGDQESCFETIPHPAIETLEYGAEGKGMKFAFQDSTVKSWSYTNAPDAEDRAIQAVYAANRWGVGDASVSAKAGMMGDFCRNDMYDKYYKKIGCQSMTADSDGGGDQGKHYLMAWYTAWGGAQDGTWAWQIGCSHAHQFYQNPLAAFGLLYDKDLNKGMQADGATKDYETSLQRQLEFYLWLSSKEGPFAGGATNCWMGNYSAYPSSVSTFYDMAYIEQPVYADPGSNNWTGNQYWATQRLAELYYVICSDPAAEAACANIKPGGMSVKEALKTVLDKWIKFFTDNTKMNDGFLEVPSSLKWSGQPETWNKKYVENSGLSASVAGWQHTDLGCVCSCANTFIYYAKANGIEASGQVKDDESNLAQHALYLAQQLMDQTWDTARDDIGLSLVDHNGSLARFWAQEVDTDGKGGKYPYYEVKDGSKFIDLRQMYKDEGQSYSDLYKKLEAAYEADVAAGAKMVEFKDTGKTYSYGMDCATDCSAFTNVASVDLLYHRFWHAGDIMMALGTMAELYPDVLPIPKGGEDTTTKETTTTTKETTTTTKDTTTTGDPKTPLYGDVNEDGTVDVKDAVLLARAVGGDSSATLSAQAQLNADVAKNDKVEAADLTKLIRFLARLIPNADLGKA